jgi:hypothetical protein
MKKIPTLFAALISGYALFYALIDDRGVLAALTVPRQYFLWFGKHITLALVVLDAFTSALPVFLISTAWTISTILILRKHYLPITSWCFCGFVLTWVIWNLYFEVGVQDALLFWSYPWLFLSTFAAPCGILFGGFLIHMAKRPQPSNDSFKFKK